MSVFIFLSSGLFLGWSLGANDAANVFGTAVGSRMISFKKAALIASIFVVLGATISGAGAASTLGKLGSVNAIAGAFMVALAAGLTVYGMTRANLPVSTSQAIVGAIIGWNLFTGSLTDLGSLQEIVLTWVLCPLLSALFAVSIYYLFRFLKKKSTMHLLYEDAFTRYSLIIAGAFGSFSLGANNIANVMGVFVPVSPFKPLGFDFIDISGTQQLFFIGGCAIAVGIFTYSRKVIETVGSSLMKLNPESALIVVLSSAIVLFLFASDTIETLLLKTGLPALPLVPVSSSQAVVGGIIGIALVHGGRGMNIGVLAKIASGWVTTPLIAGGISLAALFFVQNVFLQKVYLPVQYSLTPEAAEKLKKDKVPQALINRIKKNSFSSAMDFSDEIKKYRDYTYSERKKIIETCALTPMLIDLTRIEKELKGGWLTPGQKQALEKLAGKRYNHIWKLHSDLKTGSHEWKLIQDNRINNRTVQSRLTYLARMFKH